MYKTSNKFIPNPLNILYQDMEYSDANHIKELIELAQGLEENIEGDFDLNYLIFQIKDNALSFVKIGLITFKIKTLKLYKKVARTFKQFCQEQIGYSTWYINRLIRSSGVMMELIAAGFEILPKCESQCRELLYASEGEIVPAWRSITENFKPHEITAKSIRSHLKPEEEKDKPKTEKIEVSPDLFETIFRAAVNAQLTVVQLLEEIFQPVKKCANWHIDRKIEQWQYDLEELVNSIDKGGR